MTLFKGSLALGIVMVFGFGTAEARQRTACAEIPLLQTALSQLPADVRFPCDSQHVVVIGEIDIFLKQNPEVAANAGLRWKAEHAMAFTLNGAWPVYINLSSHPALTDAYRRGASWVAYVFAGVLAHERVHAMGDLSEAAGLLAEYNLDRRFRTEGKLPAAFDLPGLEKQYREALEAERANQ